MRTCVASSLSSLSVSDSMPAAAPCVADMDALWTAADEVADQRRRRCVHALTYDIPLTVGDVAVATVAGALGGWAAMARFRWVVVPAAVLRSTATATLPGLLLGWSRELLQTHPPLTGACSRI